MLLLSPVDGNSTKGERKLQFKCACSHTHDVWLLVVCVIYLNKQQHQSGLLPGSDPQEKYSSIWLSESDFETSFLTLVGWWLSDPPQRSSGSVPAGFSSKVMLQRRNRIFSPVHLPSLPAANFLCTATEIFLIKSNNSQGCSYPLLCQGWWSHQHLGSQASAKLWWLQPARQSEGEPAVI